MTATQVDFYLLKSPHRGGRAHLACRLANTAYRTGHKVYIQVAEAAEVARLDELLWTFSQLSFVPHATLSVATEAPEDYPVVIDTEAPPEHIGDVLIPLLTDVPAHYAQFKRVLDPIGFDEEDKRLARIRYKQYRDAGAALAKHEIDP